MMLAVFILFSFSFFLWGDVLFLFGSESVKHKYSDLKANQTPFRASSDCSKRPRHTILVFVCVIVGMQSLAPSI